MNQDSRDNNGNRSESIGKDVQEYTVHILIAVGVSVVVSMTMVVAMIKRHDTDQVHKKTCNTDDQELPEAVHLATR